MSLAFAFVLVFSLAACAKQPQVDATTAAKMEEHTTSLDNIAQRMESIAENAGVNATTAPAEAPSEETVAAPAPTEPSTGPALIDATGNLLSDGTISDSLADMEFILDNVLYCLPQTYSDLMDYGWVGEIDADQPLEARQEVWLNMTNGESTISVGVYNTEHSGIAFLKDCFIIGIEVVADDLEDMDFSIAKGINLSSTWQEVAEAFGKDSSGDTWDDDDTAMDFYYDLGAKYSVEMSFDNENPEDNTICLYFDLDS